MKRKPYKNASRWVEKYRFKLLLLASLLVLVLPSFAGKGLFNSIMFLTCMSFLFIQSVIVAGAGQKWKYRQLRYALVVFMIALFILEPVGFRYRYLDMGRLFLLILFFIFTLYYLVRFLWKSSTVSIDVIITAINIYLLIGIVFGSLAFLFNELYTEAYSIPSYIGTPTFVTFTYYSFITMSTVGYGDIVPRLPETQTLAILIAVTGQLYVAIIIAFLVGKLLMHPIRSSKT